uniref:Pre-mRNA splicing Prp18-interacting factor n=1 Tax=Tanacetum cinerariifolium TaxID=118510 RepID=A0A699JS00_TANCI|nr:hypothetical protein [Tanacetum cinerariifolium]
MASFDYHLNPLYPIKECSSCEALYTTDYCCSDGSLRDKIICDLDQTPDLSQRSPQNCPKCGNPVDCQYCQGCALLRKKFKEDMFTYCLENEILQDSFEPSNDNTNVVNALQEPFVANQDPDKNYSQKPFNNQTIDELPQTLPSFDPTCYSEDGNSFTYDSKSNLVLDSPNVFDPPLQPPLYLCEFCGNDSCYGHYCIPQVPFIYPEQCYNQDFIFPQDFHDFQQQYLCCENFEVTHEAYQCQPMNEDYYHEQNSCYDPNSFGFDKFQPLQYTVNHPIFNAQNDIFNSQNKLMEQLTFMCDMVGQFIQKNKEEKQIEEEQAANARYWKIPACYDDDDDDDYTFAITHKEPDNSLSMGDEHLDTIPATESDEFIKSSVENLVPNPNFSKEIYSNPLFDEEISSMKIDSHHFNVESDLIESLLNRNFLIIFSFLKIDSLFDEFAGELTLLKSIPPGINDYDPEDETRFIKRLLYDNSSPQIDLSFTPDYPMSPSIEEDDYDSERDILILEELLSNDSLSFPKNESFHFDIPSSYRPPAKPPDGNSGILNVKMMGDISEHKVHMPRLMFTQSNLIPNQEKSPKLLPHLGHEPF